MTKTKAKIHICKKPWEQIKWFTNHFDNEIGALGICEVKDEKLIVERLFFPQQKVGGAHVHFKPEDWGQVIKDMTMEEIQKTKFFWHKHPGSASASQRDEDDTFDAFMDPIAKRPIFGFLQTAKKYNGDMDIEPRIELRDPIRVSITDVEIETDNDEEIKTECLEIIKNCVIVGAAEKQPGANGIEKPKTTIIYPENTKSTKTFQRFRFDISNINGTIYLTTNSYMEGYVIGLLTSDLLDLVKKYTHYYSKDGFLVFEIFPNKKQGKQIRAYLDDYAEFLISQPQTKKVETEPKPLAGQYNYYDDRWDY